MEPSKCIVRDREGNWWGPFEQPKDAAQWATLKWPAQDEGEKGKGWKIEWLRPPEP